MDKNTPVEVEELRAIAAEWRARAAETQLAAYKKRMLETAEELERAAAERAAKPNG